MKKVLYVLALVAVILGGFYLYHTLGAQRLAATPGEKEVGQMKLTQSIQKKQVLVGTSILRLRTKEEVGSFLTAKNGKTLYVFTSDSPHQSNCYKQCERNWPPYLDGEFELTTEEGITGEISLTERTDGSQQITYNGQPLYFYINDKNPGDIYGHQINNIWFVAQP
ncbi:hypothetical protein JW752_05130 [Candidatus Peregrinibacteria bacterium]|nr:hypothetical protein [Candidatus Peregrinibacteria bacterium]